MIDVLNEPENSDSLTLTDVNDADDDDNPDGNFDNTIYPEYTQGQPWPTVINVLHGKPFVKFFHNANCLDLAKQQIVPATISDYGVVSQRINVYTESGGPNLAKAREAIVYINSELSNGRPIIVGVDVLPGQAKLPITDNSTDHFIVIVGSNTDSKGNYYQFYDNASSNSKFGASPFNRLYYNSSSGLISGNTTASYDNATAQALPANVAKGVHPYIVTQVRKNKKP